MKTQKTKAKSKDKKAYQKEKLEINLTEKLKVFVKSLGHDADEIGDEIKKASKILSKKLKKKIGDAKNALENKVSGIKKSKKTDKKSTSKIAKQASSLSKTE